MPTTRGFSLIETLIYLALYALLMSGTLVGMYAIFESSARTQAKAMVQQEGTYLNAKLDWIFSNTTCSGPNWCTPAAGAATSSSLSVRQLDGSTMSVQIANGRMYLNGRPISNGDIDVEIGSGGFVHTSQGSTNAPESLSADFVVSSHTSDGHVLFPQEFTTQKYLRK